MKGNYKNKLIIAISTLTLSSTLAIGISAIALGPGISGPVNGIDCHGYLYQDVPSSGCISSEATSDTRAAQLKTRVYYTEFGNPNPSSIPRGSVASKTNAVSSGYSQKSGIMNPTHAKGWYKISDGNSAYWESTKDYKFSNHGSTLNCALDNFDPEAEND